VGVLVAVGDVVVVVVGLIVVVGVAVCPYTTAPVAIITDKTTVVTANAKSLISLFTSFPKNNSFLIPSPFQNGEVSKQRVLFFNLSIVIAVSSNPLKRR
jgi:hypothetical protein